MSYSNLIRLGGLAAILGAALFIIVDLLVPLVSDFEASPSEEFTSFGYHLQSALLLIGGPLVLLGLVGLYARRPEAMGIFGLIAFLITFFGVVLAQGATWDQAFTQPALALVAPELLEAEPPGSIIFGILLSFGLVNLGWLLFAVAVLRAQVYPRPAALLLIVGSLGGLLSLLAVGGPPGGVLMYVGIVFDILFFGAIAWMGFVLLTGRDAAAEQPSPRVQ